MVKNPCHTWDIDIAALAKRQHGYVLRRQLLELGLRVGAIEWRIKIGRLIPVYRGVYAVGHLPTLPLDRAHGALLACGAGAAVSHRTAAAVWGIDKRWITPFEVIVMRRVRRPEIRTRVIKLAREDATTHLGIRVTSPARTLLDLAPHLSNRKLERARDELRNGGFLRVEHLADTLARYPRHPGASAIRSITSSPHGATRSDMELLFRDFIQRYGMPQPLINTRVGGHEVDALFPEQRVIVELDGWGWHSSRGSFQSDRRRDAELLAQGYVTVRITWERLTGEPDQEAARLRKILDARQLLLSASQLLTRL